MPRHSSFGRLHGRRDIGLFLLRGLGLLQRIGLIGLVLLFGNLFLVVLALHLDDLLVILGPLAVLFADLLIVVVFGLGSSFLLLSCGGSGLCDASCQRQGKGEGG